MRKLYLLFVIALALGISTTAFAQYGGGSGDDSSNDDSSSGSGMATAHLMEQKGSGVTGTAWLTDNGDGTTTVKVKLDGGFESGVAMPAHLHEGTVADYIPKPKYPLENLMDGMGTSTVDTSLDDVLSQDFVVAVHESEENISNVVAVGQVEEAAGTPNTGAGGLSSSSHSAPAAGLALVGLFLAAGALMVARPRGI